MFDTPAMKKLDDETLPNFMAERGLSLVLFGSQCGGPSLAQSHVFAELWADNPGTLRFGYIDALCNDVARKRYAVRLLPTILAVRAGRVLAKLEGFHARKRLETLLKSNQPTAARAA